MQIGDYLAERIIETSDNVTGTATVHLARHLITNATAYLTVFQPNPGTDGKLWIARIRAIRALTHPALVPFVAGGKAPDGTLYVATDAFPPVVKIDSALSLPAVIKMSKQISEALDYAHANDLVHGRLDRQHVVLVDKGQVAIRGFELSEVNEAFADDIRGLAAFIHLALTGEDVIGDEYGEDLSPELPLVIAGVLQAALTTAPYATVTEFHQAFEAVALKFMAAHKTSTQTIAPVQAARPRSRSIALMLLVVVLLIGAGLFGLYVATQSAAGNTTPTIAVLESTATLTLTTTPTSSATVTASHTATETATDTDIPTQTMTATDDPTSLALLAATAIVADTATPISTSTPTVLPSSTPTELPPTATSTATVTATPTETPLPPTETPSPTATSTFTPSRVGLVTATPMATLIPSDTPSSTPFPSETPTPSNTPFPSDTPAASPTPLVPTSAAVELNTQACVAMVGDSVTAGTGVYEIAGYGYAFIQAQHVSVFVEQRFSEIGKPEFKGVDRGSPNTGISSSNHPSYFVTDQYTALLQDNCRYTVIMPWINDITPLMPAETASQRHVKVIGDLVKTIVANNPYGRVIVLNYWEGVVSDFARRTWAAGFNSEDIAYYNNAIRASCTGGALSQISQVICVNSHDVFAGMGDSYVIKVTTHDELYALLAEPPANNSKVLLESFFDNNPNGQILGDGVHLSPAGKRRLAEFLVDTILSLPPL